MTVDDKILYDKFLQGDISAFESLVINYKDNLIYFITRYTKEVFIAEDIAQDVFAHIYVNKENYNFKYSFKTYLFTLAKNKAIDYVRKQNRLVLTPFDKDYESLSQEESLEEKIIKDEEARELLQAIKELKADYSRAIFLADIEDLSYKEIARILGKTMGQTKVLIHRARKALQLGMVKGAEEGEK